MLKWNNTNQNKGIACDNNEKERGLIKKIKLGPNSSQSPEHLFSAFDYEDKLAKACLYI